MHRTIERRVYDHEDFAISTVTAGAVVAAALGMAGAAAAAPPGPSLVADTVASLQADGYKVIVTRLSGGDGGEPTSNAEP
jgi:hypothetical protein